MARVNYSGRVGGGIPEAAQATTGVRRRLVARGCTTRVRSATHVLLVSGDGDLLSAVELAQSEGVVVWLAHGPSNTWSSELWSAVDNRIALDASFLQRIARDW